MYPATPPRLVLALLASVAACAPAIDGHGPIAEGIMGDMGSPLPSATAEQRATFERGHAVAVRRFSRADGLGPAFNLTFCGGCHEKPVIGGSAGLYRNFALSGVEEGGLFTPGMSAGNAGGVIRLYYQDKLPELVAAGNGTEGCTDAALSPYAHPPVPAETNVVAQRNPIPFFGVGLLAELPAESILAHADPDDADGDGISGKANFATGGFVGRFGVKSQTASIEGFIRGPLFNHLGVTTEPLTNEEKAALPVDSSVSSGAASLQRVASMLTAFAQAEAPASPTVDDDCVPDPEMSHQDLFDLVSFSMLLAAPKFDTLTEAGIRGRDRFDAAGCGSCHVPRLDGPRGPIPAYTDLLLHDMGPDLADGIVQLQASGSEFRTQPLWGVAATGPYLHDGRAQTLPDAIALHGGEGAQARDAWLAMADTDKADLLEFLLSLGGRAQFSLGLVPPGDPIPEPATWGGPIAGLTPVQLQDFDDGRHVFDEEFGFDIGVGGPRFNGDSCRACHFEPVVGGAGPRGVNVVRHGLLIDGDHFVPPAVGTILHRVTGLGTSLNRPQEGATVFELRQTPHLFGLGLIERIPNDEILSHADPEDLDGDGISGKPSWVDGERLGRFGWKAQVPSLREFVRDAVTMELGMTLPYEEGQTFGRIQDNDAIADPELGLDTAGAMLTYLSLLGPPPRTPATDAAAAAAGEGVFTDVGCAACHIPALQAPDGPVPLYSDLLLHEILPPGAVGIEEAGATMREFRTAPLWGIARTAPYLHNGAADTLTDAVRAHDGEAAAVRDAWLALSEAERAQLLAFLETL